MPRFSRSNRIAADARTVTDTRNMSGVADARIHVDCAPDTRRMFLHPRP